MTYTWLNNKSENGVFFDSTISYLTLPTRLAKIFAILQSGKYVISTLARLLEVKLGLLTVMFQEPQRLTMALLFASA